MVHRFIRMITREAICWFGYLIRVSPGQIGIRLRRAIYSRWLNGGPMGLTVSEGVFINGFDMIKVGNNVSFGRECTVHSALGEISIGDRCSFNDRVWMGSDFGSIVIGNNVLVGPYSVFRSANHKYDGDGPIIDQGHTHGVITIGDNVWIGAHVTIIPGANVGRGSIIAAGAVVNGSIPPHSLATGIPAKVLRRLTDSEQVTSQER